MGEQTRPEPRITTTTGKRAGRYHTIYVGSVKLYVDDSQLGDIVKLATTILAAPVGNDDRLRT
ncbi:hypothetical protein HLY00_1047 [Mycolicibacterium hippocampi]|uniref:Uncharacterized protein n=1 Tax=Mycolicibacterium hippocampi TaxID=659824 RepID=A0A850PUP2_9MYCO|nr:hypothetical protein [Mycolicibacterium hippocampi]